MTIGRDYTKQQFVKLLAKYGFRKVEFDLLNAGYYRVAEGVQVPTSHLPTRRAKLAYLIQQDRKWRERREKTKQDSSV